MIPTSDPDGRLLRLALEPEPTVSPRADLFARIAADVASTPQTRGLRLPGFGWLTAPSPAVLSRVGALALLLLGLVAWIYLLGQRPEQTLPLANGDIFFVRGGDLWRVPPEGGDPTLVGETPGVEEASPIWSPDLARAAMLTTRTDGAISLELMDANGGNRRVLVTGPEYLPSWEEPIWSPDGRQIAIVDERRGYPTVMVVDADTAAVHKLAADWPLVGPEWSPDGRWIAAFTPGGVGSEVRVVLLDPAGAGAQELFSDTGSLHGLSWTPDSSAMIFSIDRVDGADIFRLQLDGRIDRLTQDGTDPVGARLSPDGTRIAFGDRYAERCTAHAYVMNIDGSDVRRLRETSWVVGWSPDGQWVVVLTEAPLAPLDGGLVALRADGSASRTIVSWTQADVGLMTNGGWCTRDIGSFGGIGWQGVRR